MIGQDIRSGEGSGRSFLLMTSMSKRSGFAFGQTLMLFIIAFISVISKPRLMLLEINNQTNIPIEFRTLLVSLPDLFVFGLLLITAVRLVFDDPYRARLLLTTQQIITRLGGIWWVLLILWMAVSLLWAREPALQRFSTTHALLLLLVAFILADLAHEWGVRAFLWGLLLSAGLQALVAIFQVVNSGPLGWWALGEIDRFSYETTAFYRAPGLSMHPNYLGGYFVVALFACISLGVVARQRKSSLFAFIMLISVLSVVGMVATLSRSAMLSTLIGLTPLVLYGLLRANPKLRLFILGGVGLALLVVMIWGYLVLAGNIQARIFSPREFFFDYSWEVITQSPFLGVGAGNLMIAVGDNRLEYVAHLLPVHNVYLYIWAELGLPGLALFLLGCFSVVRQWRQQPIWVCCFVAICIIMLFDNYWWAVHPFRVLFFGVIGLCWINKVSAV